MSNQSKDVVVVEDQAMLAFLLVELVNEFGHKAISFANGHEALHYLRSSTPDLLITDLFMPEMGGSELIEAMFSENIHIPTVIVSGVSKLDIYEELSVEVIKLFDKTNVRFIEKPLNEFNIRLLQHYLDSL